MNLLDKFDLMRPYNDAEVAPALKRIIENQLFKVVVGYLYDDKTYDEVIKELKDVNSVYGFQKIFSDYAVKKIIEKTSDGLSYSGLENLDSAKPYLFIANHRDIVLDSAIMQIILFGNNYNTSQITFGDNLMSSQFVVDLGKMNKMFTFYRGGCRNEQYENALLHSAYIHHTIKNNKESVWIAQRDGRTKDGNDATQVSLIKMLSMGCKNMAEALESLNIVPVAISYEYEPCDIQKTYELYHKEHMKYVKAADEDFKSVMSGITSFKGKIHLHFGSPLNCFLRNIQKGDDTKNDIATQTAAEIDKQIYRNFKLHPFHYIAFDILNNIRQYAGIEYTEEKRRIFEKYMKKNIDTITGDKEKLTAIFCRIYANPVINAKNCIQA